MKNLIKENFYKITEYIGLAIEFIFALIFSFSTLHLLIIKNYSNIWDKSYIIISGIFLVIIGLLIFKDLRKNYKKIEHIFLHVMILIGSLYLVFLMPLKAPDEIVHGYRAYEISNGNLVTPQNEKNEGKTAVPVDLLDYYYMHSQNYFDLLLEIEKETNYEETREEYNSAQGYCFLLYIPASLGFLISRIFNFNIIIAIYLARTFNFIFFILAGYIALKIIPFGKLMLFIYLFNSMLIHQAVSISADSVINSNIILFISYLLYLTFSKKELKFKSKIILLVMSVVIAVSKNVYIPILFFNLILLANKEIKNKKNIIFIVSLISIGIIIGVGVFLFGTTYKDVIIDVVGYDYNPKEQIKFIITNPLKFAKVIVSTLIHETEGMYFSCFGSCLGSLNIEIENELPIMFYTMLLFISCFMEQTEIELDKKTKLMFFIIAILIIGLIFLAFYVMSTLVADITIKGIQGRYFIPIVLLLLIPIIKKENYIKIKYPLLISLFFICMVNIYGIITILKFFVS